ncbi:unnamed protein product [Penicillium olsonii]|nr:unnamed protein product [Penicillium olsonii]
MPVSDPCIFPVLADVVDENQADGYAEVSVKNTQLESDLRGKNHTELLAIFKAAWSLVLYSFCEAKLVSFAVDLAANNSSDNTTTKVDDVYQGKSSYEIPVTPKTTLKDISDGFGAQSTSDPSRSDQGYNTGLSITIAGPSDPSDPSIDASVSQKHPNGTTNPVHSVQLRIVIDADKVEITIHYNTAVLAEKQAQDVASTLEQAITCIIHNPGHTVGQTSLISPRNHEDIERWTSADLTESSQMIHEIFRQHSTAAPDATAVSSWDGDFTYRELDMASDRVAAHLAGLGVGAGALIPVCFEKSRWFVVAALAIIKAGGCYVPLDPSQPISRLHTIVEEVEATLLLATSQTADKFSGAVKEVIILSESTVADLPIPEDAPISSARSSDPGYMLFTSGSTGTPKGCMVTHGALASVAESHGPALQINRDSRVFQFASFAFGMSVIDVFCTLANGATVCIPSESERTGDIVGAYNRMQVTWAIATPSLVKSIDPNDIPSLQTLVIAGEALPKSVIQIWAARVQLVQAYGLTEWAGICSATKPLSSSARPADIGFPPNARCWLVDPEDPEKLVPVGAVGEMMLEGPCLANGYFKKHEQTAQRFISPPSWRSSFSSPLASNKLYLTGDLMRYGPDGSCSYVGRAGTQVKIRGQRVELGEVEYHVAKQFGSIAKAVIAETLIPNGDDRSSLVAFILESQTEPQSEDSPVLGLQSERFRITVQATSTALSKLLPRYMLPDFYVPITRIPFTVSRKTSRKDLRELGSQKTREELNEYMITQSKCRLPSTPAEHVLHGIFASVLNQDPSTIGVDDSFFQLGGDSIVAMRAIMLSRKQQISLTIQDIFRYRSVAEIAKSLPIKVVNKSPEELREFDLSSVQQAFLQRNSRSPNDQSQKLLLKLRTQVDVETVRYAVSDLSKRHSILRIKSTRGESGEWSQCVQEHSSAVTGFRANLISDTTEIPRLFEEMQKSLSIENGRVFTATITESDSGERHLLLVAHEFVVDKMCWPILCKELDRALHGQPITEGSPLSFRKWCQSQRERSAAVESISLVPKQPSDDAPQNVISQTTLELDGELSGILVGKANVAFDTQPIDVLHAGLRHSFMKHMTCVTPPAFFLEVSARESPEPDLSQTVGWCSAIVPAQFTVSSESDVVELIRRAKDARKSSSRVISTGENAPDLGVLLRFDPGDTTAQWEGDALKKDHSIDTDAGTETFPPLATVDVIISFADGKLKFVFRHDEESIPSDRIKLWMADFELSLQDAAAQLSDLKPGFTPGDLALPSISYNNLQEVLPCSPMQQGILLSRDRDPTVYTVGSIWKVTSGDSSESEKMITRIQDAWGQVLDRHDILRTIFVQSHANNGAYDQVVLKTLVPNVDILDLEEGDPLAAIRDRGQVEFQPEEPQHRLILCKTGDALYLGLMISHALIDAQSVSIIFRDLLMAYDGKLPGERGPLYGKYISFLQGQDSQRSIDYWTNHLQGAVPCILPSLDYHHSDVEQHRELKTFDFDIENLGQLQQFCSEQNITISNLCQLAWGLTLRCFAETDDVSFGYLAAGRDIDLDGMEEAVGPYINMLICRMVLGNEKTLQQELQSIMHTFAESSNHQHAPLGQILSSLDFSGPLFNTILSLRRPSSQMSENTSSLQLENAWELDPTEYNLAANIHVSKTSMDVSMSYWTTSCSDEQAANLANTLQKVMSTIIEHADSTPSQLDIFSEQSYMYVRELNSTVPQRSEQCAHHLIEEHVKEQPQAPAVCAWDGDFTYEELDSLASQWAAYLAHHGAAPEKFIPVLFEKSKWAIVAILATIKAGSAFVMLDPSHPPDRLRDICQEVQATIIVTSEALSDVGKQLCPFVATIDESNKIPSILSEIPFTLARPSNAIYAVFTSGSTGKPKGVTLEHSTFCTSAKAHGTTFALSNSSRVFEFSSFAFDVSLAEMLTTLCFGGCVCVPSEHDRLNDLSGAVNRLGVNTAFLTASVLGLMEPQDVPNLKKVVFAGEPMSEAVLEKWVDYATMINAYGPAECCIYCAIQTGNDRYSDPRNIGYPQEGLSWIVDPNDHDRLMPVGSVGELLVEGPLVGRGYLNNPEKTAEVFIQQPRWRSRFTTSVTGGFYKTGDLVRYGPNGTMRFKGRKGTEVKINGQRLELAEVEHYLRKYVGQSIDVLADIVYFSQPSGPPTLTAFFKPHHRQQAGANALMANLPSMIPSLKSRLRGSLPQYMVPTAYIPMEDFPVNKSDKTDRAKLRELAVKIRQEDMEFGNSEAKRPPHNEGERKIQKIVAKVLRLSIESVGLDDNFFVLGGDSSYAIKVVSAARAEGFQLTVKDILLQSRLSGLVTPETYPEPASESHSDSPSDSPSDSQSDTHSENSSATSSAEQCCELLDINDATEFISEIIAPQTCSNVDNILDVVPTTDFQEECVRTWPFTYFLLSIHGPLDKARLRAACRTLVERHEIFRTVFVSHESEILQVILKHTELPFFEHPCDNKEDLTDACEKTCAADSQALPLGELHTRFDIFFQDDSNYHLFAIRLSHAQYDGYCMPVLYKELSDIYGESELEPVTNFSTYICHLHDEGKSKALQFWKNNLKDCPAPATLEGLSLGAADGAPETLIELDKEVPLPTPPTTITVASLMKAAAALLLMQITNETDVAFGQVASGRNVGLDGIENVLGVCATLVPIRVQFQSKWTVLDLLQHVQTQQIDALEHETLGMQQIREGCTEWPQDAKLGCLIQHQNLDLKPQFSLSEAQCTTRIFGGSFKRDYLHICTLPRGNTLVVQLYAPSKLMDETHCQKALDQLCDIAFWLAANPHHLLAESSNFSIAT